MWLEISHPFLAPKQGLGKKTLSMWPWAPVSIIFCLGMRWALAHKAWTESAPTSLGNAPALSDLFVLVFVLQILCVSHGLAHNGRESESEWMGSSGYDLPAAAVSCSEEIQVWPAQPLACHVRSGGAAGRETGYQIVLIIVGSGFWIKRVCTDYVKRRKTSTCFCACNFYPFHVLHYVSSIAVTTMCTIWSLPCLHLQGLCVQTFTAKMALPFWPTLCCYWDLKAKSFALPLLSVIAMSCRRYTWYLLRVVSPQYTTLCA